MINIEYLEKTAEEYKLKDYQQRVVNKMVKNDNARMIALHSMGSGKTLTALATFDAIAKNNPKAKMMYIVPAPLVSRTPSEIKKYNLKNLKNLKTISYEMAAKNAEKDNNYYDITILDEAHRLRNGGSKRAQAVQGYLDNSSKVLMLTGTAGYNHPADMYALINRLNPDLELTENHAAFNARYVYPDYTLHHKQELSKLLNTYYDKYEVPSNSSHFPQTETKVIHIPMTTQQQDLYKFIENNKLPKEIASKMRAGLDLTPGEAGIANMYFSGVRQAANTPSKFTIHGKVTDSPKITTALNSMVEHAKNNKNFRGIVYSNYLDAGIVPYAEGLKNKGITPYMFTGKTPDKEKTRIIAEYNKFDNKPKALLLSSAGGEGLDLKRTNLIQVLEPHFNEPKLDQVKARAIRYDSHKDIPKNQRKVSIEEYRSSFNDSDNPTIDDILSNMSSHKQQVVDQMVDLIGKAVPEETLNDKVSDFWLWNHTKTKNIKDIANRL